jgi:Aspartyl protease
MRVWASVAADIMEFLVTKLNLRSGASQKRVLKAMKEHVLVSGELVGSTPTRFNASRAALRPPAHDSRSGRFATPYLCDSYIRDSALVYPGALPICSQLFLALLFFVAVASSQEQFRTFRIRFHSVNGMILLDAEVNGKPATLLLDTGANDTSVDARSAGFSKMFPDKLRSTGVVGAEGRCAVREVRLTLDHRDWHNRRVCVMDLGDATRHIGTRIDGLVGQDILRTFSAVRIDYKNQVVELEPAQ